MPALTVSGNEISDATRALAELWGTAQSGGQTDGRSDDSSFFIGRAATNLHARGQCDATTHWTWSATSTTVDPTTPAPFSPQSIKAVCDGSVGAQGNAARSLAGDLAAAAGTLAAGSLYMKGTPGLAYDVWIRWENGDGSVTEGAKTVVIATGEWQQIKPATLAVAVGKVGKIIYLFCRISGAARADTFWTAHAMIEQGKAVVAPYVPTSGGATATKAAARVRAPAALLDETQGWVAMRVRMGWASTTDPHGANAPVFFAFGDDTNNRIMGYYDPSTNVFAILRRNGGAGASRGYSVVSFAVGDAVTVVFRWTATAIGLSINGAAFIDAADTAIPTLAATTFDIGTAGTLISGREIDSDVLWFACGTGTLTDTDAASLHAFGNTDKAPEDFIAAAAACACTATWAADTAAYIDEAFTIIGDHVPHLRIDLDHTNNPTSSTRTWTDITAYARDLDITRGRENELARSSPGVLRMTLDNLDRRFDPTNTDGPYYPGIKPTRRVRVRARWGVTDYNLFHGYIDEWPLEWPEFAKDAIVRVEATDAFKILNLHDLAGQSYASHLTGTRLGTVLADAGFGTAEYDLDEGQSTLVASGTITSTRALPHAQDVVETENGVLFVDGGGTVIFQDRHHRILNETAVAGTVADTVGAIRYRGAAGVYGDSQLWNQARVTPSGGTTETVVDASSTAIHYTRSLDRSLLVADQSEALNCAQYLTGRYATPTLHIPSVEIVGARDTDLWPTILAREISDRILFELRPAGGGTISEEGHIEMLSYRVAREPNDFRVGWRMSSVDNQAGWVAGDPVNSLAGVTTRSVY